MNQHEKHDHHGHAHAPASKSKSLHKDWRAWTVVALMLAAMAAYIMSMDEAIEPGVDTVGERVPAAAE